MDAFTAQQTTELVARIGAKKATMRLDKLFVNSLMTGPLLGFGCALTLSVNAAPWYQENAPGLIRMIGALLFPIGLTMIVLTGSELFTSNIMFMTVALCNRRITIVDLAKNWFISFFGNLAGMLFFMAIITGYGGVFHEEGYKEAVFTFAKKKCLEPQWHQIFLRAIGANWLVCMAVFLSISSREIVSKIIAIWWPTATFVALALDHVIANMYFIPTAIFYGDPQISTSFYIWKSLIPTTLGNIIGGGLLVGVAYWYLYLLGETVEIDFNTGSLASAVAEQAGPTGRFHPSHHQSPEVIHGQAPSSGEGSDTNTSDTIHLPHSGGGLQSGISKELSAEKYGPRNGHQTDEEKMQV